MTKTYVHIEIKEGCYYCVRPASFGKNAQYSIYESYAPNRAREVYSGSYKDCAEVLRISQFGE